VTQRLRNEQAGATYHVIARGVDRRRIFVDDEDFALYTRLLATVTERQGWHLLCYCLMPNHVHLVIETPDTNLGNGMQWLHGRYARAFNARHRRSGHLFETRYKSPVVRDGDAFVTTVAYIVLNPVAAALCNGASGWRWSSHGVLSAGDEPSWIAHARLGDRFEEITGSRSYPELVAGRERALRAERTERIERSLGRRRLPRHATSKPAAEHAKPKRSRKRKAARRSRSLRGARRSPA
jgi:REP element-mobilizing transposase RayT